MRQIEVTSTERSQLIDVTAQVASCVESAGVDAGVCVVYCPHTTAAVTVNEHADPDVAHDLLLHLDRAAPRAGPGFRHGEGNSDSHIKAALVGPSVALIVREGRLALGTWQGVFFCEFDGPRRRQLWVEVVAARA